MARDSYLTVAEAAETLGTTPQTVRALLRKGELDGRKQVWGTRYVWEVSQEGVDEFLAEYGRLEGHRRQLRPSPPPDPESFAAFFSSEPARRPFVLRPRGRATVVVVVLGIPLALMYGVARVLPDILWFQELGQAEVLRRFVAARLEFYLLVAIPAALFVGANLALTFLQTDVVRTRVGVLGITAVSVVTGSLFASAAQDELQTFLLWRHRQSFGVVDPIHGKDVGFFVFTLPFELVVLNLLLGLVAVTAVYVAVVNLASGTIQLKPPRARFGVTVHFAILAAIFLLLIAWRLRLEEYLLQLGQPTPGVAGSFSGADYVDVRVRSPGLTVMAALVVVLAVACVAAPFAARSGRAGQAVRLIALPAGALVLAVAMIGALIPALVQRFVVDPNPLLSEAPYLERSIAGTRTGLGLDTVDVQSYAPTGRFSAADFAPISERLATVPVWDSWVLDARMRQLVTDKPYYSPAESTIDVTRLNGRPQPTLVSGRQLDLDAVGDAQTWINDRLAYTHGLGLIRFSGRDIDRNREPRLIDSGLGIREPRIYFGSGSQNRDDTDGENAPAILEATADADVAESPWVLVNTRRPEVDIPVPGGASVTSYHYDGPGGIEMSSWVRRAAFALALGSKEMLLSDDITPESRLLLHRDVHDRLHTLAPFVQWDSEAVPLTANGRIVFVVDGYTTSQNYPYAELVDLGGAQVNYARASVRATVDAFTGQTELYLEDEAEPIARAWAEIFPSLFRPMGEMPAELRPRLRYPIDLFNTQATAYESFHATRPDLFASEADLWSRPLALSGPIEVAGDIDFDESDEDDLRLILQPAYKYVPPPGLSKRRLTLETYYTPSGGQNLVANLSGWIDEHGRARLASRNLPRDPVTLGPAQMSRLAFATSRVRNLLGLRNLEIRDLDKSSLDSVLLGRPRLIFLPGGVLQLQSLYEGSRGPGAARLLGVTAFLDGRTGLGPDIDSALRQALNHPPQIEVLRPEGPVVFGTPIELAFHVESAKREVVTITSAAGRQTARLDVSTGRGTVRWVPPKAGPVRVRVEVAGLDGTSVVDSTTFRVLSPPPAIRLIGAPARPVVGRPVEVSFRVTNGLRAVVEVSTNSGIVFTRNYLIQDGTGLVEWTPTEAGKAVLVIRARGRQGQTTSTELRLDVAPRPPVAPAPDVEVLRPEGPVVFGTPIELEFHVESAKREVVTITSAAGRQTARLDVSTGRGTVRWVPPKAGPVRVRVEVAGLDGTSVVDSTTFRVLSPPPAIRLIGAPARPVVGRPVEVSFRVTNGLRAVVEVSTNSGIVFTRNYLIQDGTGLVEWTPTEAGKAVLVIRARGRQGQTTSTELRLDVAPRPPVAPAPDVEVLRAPEVATVGRPSQFVFRAGGCSTAVARIEALGADTRVWRFTCPSRRATFTWTPRDPGSYLLTAVASGSRTEAQVTRQLTVKKP